MIKTIRHIIGKRYNLLRYLKREYLFLFKSLGSCDTKKTQNKEREQLIMQSHVIEKGLSLRDVRLGFGIPKIVTLLTQLRSYTAKYNDQETLIFVLSVIEAYIKFHKKNNAEVHADILNLYSELAGKIETKKGFENLEGGILSFEKKQILDSLNADFETFARSRHSLRQFTGEPINKRLLENALSIAETTPSACNRQPWHTYVFTKKENIVKILDIQMGARQFKEDVSALIIVTATPNAFYGPEYHQHFVNGGLYAMNMLYALHSQGLGAIPLNGGVEDNRAKKILEQCKGSDHDELILVIAVGQMPETFTVAKSARISFKNYTKYD